MFDTTMTDSDFKRDFVNQNADWMQNARPAEPDLEVEALDQSVMSRLLALLGLS